MTREKAIAVTADEFYTYAGDPDTDRPPYWVARHGLTVTVQIGDDAPSAETFADVATARADYAETTCDPDGASAPQVGDTITAFDHPGQFEVTSVERREGEFGPRFLVGGHRSGVIDISYATYGIIARPECAS